MTDGINSQAIARIYRQSEGQQSVEGMGFLITECHVLTCSHVINTALGYPEDSPDQPDDRLLIDFPFIEDNQVYTRHGVVVRWSPMNDQKRDADVALLQLNQSMPASVCPVKLYLENSISSSSWESYGSTKVGSYWTGGTLAQQLTDRGWGQLDVSVTKRQIDKGFSGSPVWCVEHSNVLGMVVALLGGIGTKPAFMLPALLLESVVNYADATFLLNLLDSSSDVSFQVMQEIYHQCLPVVWDQPRPVNLKTMLETLSEDVPPSDEQDGQFYSALSQFVASLLLSSQLSASLEASLRHWLSFRVKNTIGLFEFVEHQRASEAASAGIENQASLLIRLIPSQKDDLKKYRFQAWLVSNPLHCDQERVQGYEPLTVSQDADQTYAWAEVPTLIQQCLNQAAGSPHNIVDPTLECFLPVTQLNNAVEALELPVDIDDPFVDPEALPDQVGWRYRLVLRSTERTNRRYQETYVQKIADWREKWKRATAVFQNGCQACTATINGNDPTDNRPLNQRLSPLNTFGVRFSQISGISEIITVLRESVPIAVWLRQPIPNAEISLDTFLRCPLRSVPDNTQTERSRASNPNTDLGCHLAILWDNPNLLPPDKAS